MTGTPRVLLLTGDATGHVSGCGLYRMLLPAQQLRAAGWDVSVRNTIGGYTRTLPTGLVECYDVPALDFDVVVFQRPMPYTLSTIVPLVAQWAAVVVELDDDLERTSPDNGAYLAVSPRTSPAENWNHLKAACRHADLLTCTTEALTRYTPGRSAVLPNFVPESLTKAQRAWSWQDGKPRVGWSGQVATHPHDLQTTRGGVARALAATGTDLHVVGNPERVREHLGLHSSTVMTESGWVPIGDYPSALTAIDIGIVPLEDSRFNDAKSRLKGIEFAGLGIPFVASPTPDYIRLHDEHGIGLIARRPRDWERLLTRLITDESYRRELGESWRETVAGNLTYESNGWRWMQAYEQAARTGAARRGTLTTAGR